MIGILSARLRWEIQRRRSDFSKRTRPDSIGQFSQSCEIEKMRKMQIQESWCRAYANLDSFEGRSAFPTWLTRIAINSALMLRRGRAIAWKLL